MKRLERLEAALDRLRQDAASVRDRKRDGPGGPGGKACELGPADATIVVEGRRDLAALRALGVGGRHTTVHGGRSLQDFADSLAGARLILLVDWDRTGGRLCARIEEALQGRAQVDTDHRRRLARATQCSSFEEVPAEMAALRREALRRGTAGQ